MKKYIPIIAGLLFTVQSHGEVLEITSLESGQLTWTNRVADAQYRVEWKSTLTDEWQTNSPVFSVTSTSNVSSIDIPMYFRVVWMDAPSVRFERLSTPMPSLGSTEIDLNNDSVGDLFISSGFNSTPEGGITTQEIYIRGTDIVSSPFPFGAIIDSNLTWQSSTSFFAGRSDFGGPFTSGHWAGVTNAFLPFRLAEGTNYLYGWVNIKEYEYSLEGVPVEGGITNTILIKNFRLENAAYQTTPNESICAGQTE